MNVSPLHQRAEQLRRLFDEVAGLAPDERTARLDHACADDPELRRDVEALLRVDAHVDDVLSPYEQFLLTPPAGDIEEEPRTDPSQLVGQTLSHYQIEEKLGAGGMGVVYKAHDTKLDRTVALKFLPSHLTTDDEARARYTHEAKAASALDHANICTIHDIDKTDAGQLFIVMAYYRGETLKKKISRGPLPIDEALAYATQIAQGLSKAHEAGIVHRDVKSANVMVTEEGQVKIVDFGLAKVAGQTRLTQSHTTLGTVVYMSPEQARGENVDHRTDIWSLGVVLYEILSGQTPFKGDFEQAVVYSILNEEPESLTGLRTGLPPALERVVLKCLAKNASERYQHVDEVLVDLRATEKTAGSRSREAATSKTLGRPPRWARWKQVLPWILTASIALVATWALTRPSPEAPRPPTRLAIPLPPDQHLSTSRYLATPIALSPDGTHLAYIAQRGGVSQLYLRALDQYTAEAFPGTKGASSPFFSPDGRWVGFYADGMLKKVSLAGGTPLKICDTPLVNTASWGLDNTIVFSGNEGDVFQVSAAGGTPRVLIAPDSTRYESFQMPHMLPGGKSVLFTERATPGSLQNTRIVVQSLETGQRQVLIEEGTDARYVPTGHLVYRQTDKLSVAPFDIVRRELRGTPMPMLDAASMAPGEYLLFFAVSDNGTLMYVLGRDQNALVLVDREGRATPFAEPRVSFKHPRFSPDGQRVVVDSRTTTNDRDIWVYDVERGGSTRLTYEGDNLAALWTPDGERITFASFRGGPSHNLYWIPADGSGEAQLLQEHEHGQFPGSWSPDGRLLAYYEISDATQRDLWVLSVRDSVARPFLTTSFNERAAIFSPDGRWLAYTSDESRQDEVYVRRYPDSGPKHPISTDGGYEPVWAPDGRELFYRHGDTLMVVTVETEPVFKAGKPRKLFDGPYVWGGMNPEYDISPDGKQFVMIKADSGPAQIYVVQNWFEELQRLVPTDK